MCWRAKLINVLIRLQTHCSEITKPMEAGKPLGFDYKLVTAPLSVRALNAHVSHLFPSNYRHRVYQWREVFGISAKERRGHYSEEEATILLNCAAWVAAGGFLEDYYLWIQKQETQNDAT